MTTEPSKEKKEMEKCSFCPDDPFHINRYAEEICFSNQVKQKDSFPIQLVREMRECLDCVCIAEATRVCAFCETKKKADSFLKEHGGGG